jgi:hypothetical protein
MTVDRTKNVVDPWVVLAKMIAMLLEISNKEEDDE